MRLVAVDGGEIGDDALMGVGYVEIGGLAHDHRPRPGEILAEPGDGVGDAETCGLLVVGKQDVDRPLEVGGEHVRDGCQRQGAEALHVHGAAPVGPPIGDPQGERIGGPGLSRHRHHVGMAGQDDAAIHLWADRREDRRLVTRFIGDAHMAHAPAVEIGADAVDEREIGARTLRVEGDEARQQVERAQPFSATRHRPKQVSQKLAPGFVAKTCVRAKTEAG